MAQNRYDYIIAGAGPAGLSLAWHMMQSSLSESKVLIVDRNLQPRDDKTWCFWHDGAPPFQAAVSKSWKDIEVSVRGNHIRDNLEQHTYSCIRSRHFTEWILKNISECPSIDLLEGNIEQIKGGNDKATISVDGTTYVAEFVFQSCFMPADLNNNESWFPLKQHFLGWDVETTQNVFDPGVVTLMDFDEPHQDGLAFMYVLPWSERSALLEYTIFSPTLKHPSYYTEKIELYLFNRYKLKRLNYGLSRTELGEIPLRDLPYEPWYAPRVLNMGTAGGLTKPSTGYTFTRIQEHARNVANHLNSSGLPALPPRSPLRYRAYDLWLLQIMYHHPEKALDVFHDLFRNNSFDSVFHFLGENSTLAQDFQIMRSVPYTPFLKALWATRKRLFAL
jgi:lycopene beta-cyclase